MELRGLDVADHEVDAAIARARVEREHQSD
jgi:hypothetical protein